MAEVSREMLQRIAYDTRAENKCLDTVIRSVRGNVISAAGRGQRWWREEVFDAAVDCCGRGAVTTATVGAVQEALFMAFPGTTVRYVFESYGGRMKRILEVDWS